MTEAGEARARVRIFTPEWELPFAGHPTLGTAWVLGRGRGVYTLELDVGPVQVTFEEDTHKDELAWMVPPPVRFDGTFPAQQAAALVGLSEDQLDGDFPVRLAEVGPKFVLIGVRDLAALRAARLDESLHQEHLAAGVGVQCVFVFSAEPYSPDAQFRPECSSNRVASGKILRQVRQLCVCCLSHGPWLERSSGAGRPGHGNQTPIPTLSRPERTAAGRRQGAAGSRGGDEFLKGQLMPRRLN